MSNLSMTYLILHPDKGLAWNWRKQEWTSKVTAGCRYMGRHTGYGLTTSLACDLAAERLEAPIYNEGYIRHDPLGHPESTGLTFA